MNTKFKISIVAASRNDNHGGAMLPRMTLFVNGLKHQCNKFKIRIELILVDWNPPGDKPLLKDVLPLPKNGDFLTLRFVVVPPEIHDAYQHAKNLPLYQMIAKNVGIRRAKSDFILCTNVDLIFNDHLFKLLSENEFQKGSFYRANRCDVPASIDYNKDVESLLKFCSDNILSRLGKDNRYLNVNAVSPRWARNPFIGYTLHVASELYNLVVNKDTRYSRKLMKLDMYACGDFTMMSKSDWEEIDGYIELDSYSIHIDSLAIGSAIAIGKKQIVFPSKACTYHISHEDGWEMADPVKKIFKDLERPMLDWTTVRDAIIFMMKNQEIIKINKKDWGYLNHSFEEFSYNE